MGGGGDLDVTIDIIIPSLIIGGLFLINGIILYIIFKKRQLIEHEDSSRRVTIEDTDQEEEPSTSNRPLQPVPAISMPEKDESFELSRL